MKKTEISFHDFWQIIQKRWKLILGIMLFGTTATAIVTFILPNVFNATITLMPLEANSVNLNSIIPESLQSMAGLSSLTGRGGGSEKIINILESRALGEEVAQQLKLQALFPSDDPNRRPDPVRKLLKIRTITDNHHGLILISVQYTDPNLAAAIANSYVSCLQKFFQKNAFSLAKKNRLFIEEQLSHYSEKLRVAEEKFKEFQTQKKIVSIDAQSQAAINALADIKAQIINKTVQLVVIKGFATINNPEVIRLKDELKELEKQSSLMEEKQENLKSDSWPSLQETPELGVKYLRLKREVSTLEKVYEMLTQQFILAQIQESREALSFQIIDKAIPPDQKIRPRRILSILIAALLATFIAVVLSFLLEA